MMRRFATGGAVVVAASVESPPPPPQPATSSSAAAAAATATRRLMRAASLAVEPALEQMSRRDRVLGRLAAEALRERGREALVGGLDRHGDELPQRGHEQLRLGSLLAVLAAKRQRQAHDDLLRLELGHEPGDLGKAALGRCLADDADGAGQRAARVGDGDAGAGGAVVERENPHVRWRPGSCAPLRRARR